MIQTKNNKKNKQNRLNCIFAFNKLFKSIWISSIYKCVSYIQIRNALDLFRL